MSQRVQTLIRLIVDHLSEMNSNRRGLVFQNPIFDETIHTFGVAYFAAALAKRRRLDPELAYIIGLFHDIGRISQDIFDASHAPGGASLAQEIMLSSSLFNAMEITTVVSAIHNHSRKEVSGAAYDELLKDADILERLFCMEDICETEVHHRRHLTESLKALGLELRPYAQKSLP